MLFLSDLLVLGTPCTSGVVAYEREKGVRLWRASCGESVLTLTSLQGWGRVRVGRVVGECECGGSMC